MQIYGHCHEEVSTECSRQVPRRFRKILIPRVFWKPLWQPSWKVDKVVSEFELRHYRCIQQKISWKSLNSSNFENTHNTEMLCKRRNEFPQKKLKFIRIGRTPAEPISQISIPFRYIYLGFPAISVQTLYHRFSLG